MSDAAEAAVVTQHVRATPQQVFEAWMAPEIRKQWWTGDDGLHCDRCEIDPRVGGRYRVGMKDDANDKQYVGTGEFLALDPPRLIRQTWRWESWRDSHTDSILTVALEPDGDGTKVTLTHERLPDANAVTEHAEGWTYCLGSLAAQFTQ